jgi:tRNA 2-selenouridine synthase
MSSTADLFSGLKDDSSAVSADVMELFASGVKLDLAAGGAECRAEVDDLVRASVSCSAADRNPDALIVDVRSPGEFSKGHVPGAVNVPLFTDDERAKVGTAFAKQGRGVALVLGMKAVRPKLSKIVEEILHRARAKDANCGTSPHECSSKPSVVYVHCWRGGMRSSSVTWLLLHAAPPGSLDARVVRGGYKAFRRFVLTRWESPRSGSTLTRSSSSSSIASTLSNNSSVLEDNANNANNGAGSSGANNVSGHLVCKEPRVCIVGGRTGVGKTAALLGLRNAGCAVIDLEGLASHSGSAFGWVGRPPCQPTSEHFANLVAMEWVRLAEQINKAETLTETDEASPSSAWGWIFLEDEGPHVGKCSVDPGLFQRMRMAPLVVNVVAPRGTRLRTLVEDYAHDSHRSDPSWRDAMDESVGKLRKRLGNERAEALRLKLRDGDFSAVADGLLEYYDGLYDKHLGTKRVEKREKQKGFKGHERGADGGDEKQSGENAEGDAVDLQATPATSEKETLSPEASARAGKVVECRAKAVGHRDDGGGGKHPDSLDVDDLVGAILKTLAAFEAEETPVA